MILKFKQFEGAMSNLYLLAHESETIDDFIEAYKNMMIDRGRDASVSAETRTWLEEIYDDAREIMDVQ